MLKPISSREYARLRNEHWERARNNKTYEQWLAEQGAGANRVHRMMDAIEGMLHA